jgi:predicted metalloprotease
MAPVPPTQFGYPTGLQPQRRRSGGGKVILAVVGVVVLLGLGIMVINALGGSNQASGYVNESYTPPPPDLNPPAVPKVTTVEEAQATVTNDAIYAQTVPGPTLCQVSAIDLTTASEAELQTYMTKIIGCLMTVWNDPVTKAGYELPRPPVIIYSTPITTGCGKADTQNAMYCSADQKVYYATDLPTILPSNLENAKFVVEMIMAHEFGHAIQARTGILIASAGLESRATTKPEANLMSRRLEMQADCLSGEFIRSVSKSAGLTQQDLTNLAATAQAIGDDTLSGKSNIDGNHGLAATRVYWLQLGLASTKVSVCNTYAAPADSVR